MRFLFRPRSSPACHQKRNASGDPVPLIIYRDKRRASKVKTGRPKDYTFQTWELMHWSRLTLGSTHTELRKTWSGTRNKISKDDHALFFKYLMTTYPFILLLGYFHYVANRAKASTLLQCVPHIEKKYEERRKDGSHFQSVSWWRRGGVIER